MVYGLDNTLLPRAQAAGILLPYASPAASGLPAASRLGDGTLLTTVDAGYVTLNYDKGYFAKSGLKLPTSLAQLGAAPYAALTVVESPATSSTGSGFYLATVQALGQDAALAWWRAARAAGMKVTRGWEQAYNQDFTLYGGRYPIVLSYASSPAAELFASRKPQDAAPSANLPIPGSSFLQLEGVGILKGTRQAALARKFVDFMLSAPVQKDIPNRMWVYPSVPGTPLPAVWKAAQPPQVKPAPAALLARTAALTDLWVTQVQRR